MREFQRRQFRRQAGFTLMEIIVATAIFVTVISSILVLFNYVLKINRRVQAVRQVAQASRNFTEVLAREIRNGRINYTSGIIFSNCDSNNYPNLENQAVAITTFNGEISCIYLTNVSGQGILKIERRSLSGQVTTEQINPPNFSINPSTFRFIVRPTTDPVTQFNQGVQPMVTILAEFVVFSGTVDEQIIPYQTTISSDVYDVPPYELQND